MEKKLTVINAFLNPERVIPKVLRCLFVLKMSCKEASCIKLTFLKNA